MLNVGILEYLDDGSSECIVHGMTVIGNLMGLRRVIRQWTFELECLFFIPAQQMLSYHTYYQKKVNSKKIMSSSL